MTERTGATYDAVIVGGGFAGLSAALQLGRARLTVAVVDAGSPRNRFASHAHGVLALDGVSGSEILRRAREQILAYPTVTLISGQVVDARGAIEDFEVELADGAKLTGRRLLLAGGMRDVLPDIPGVAERWGSSALHCPWCHGYEVGGGPIGVLGRGEMAGHYALMVSNWGDATVFLQPDAALSADEERLLTERGVALERTPIAHLEGSAPGLEAAVLTDGRRLPIKALFVGASVEPTNGLAADLGCAFTDTPVGRVVTVDPVQQTSISGVFAAGDLARAASNITWSITDGMAAGHAIFRSIKFSH